MTFQARRIALDVWPCVRSASAVASNLSVDVTAAASSASYSKRASVSMPSCSSSVMRRIALSTADTRGKWSADDPPPGGDHGATFNRLALVAA